MRTHLLKKPLRDNLIGLLNRLDLLDDGKVNQALHDCILFILAEVSRIDQARRAAL